MPDYLAKLRFDTQQLATLRALGEYSHGIRDNHGRGNAADFLTEKISAGKCAIGRLGFRMEHLDVGA